MSSFTLSTLPAPTARPCRAAPLNNRHCNTSFSPLRLSSYLLLLIHTPRPASNTATLLTPNSTSHKLSGPAMPFPSLTRRHELLPALPHLSPLTGRCSSSSCRADAGNSSAGTRLSVRVWFGIAAFLRCCTYWWLPYTLHAGFVLLLHVLTDLILFSDTLRRIIRLYYRLSPVQIYNISQHLGYTTLNGQRRCTVATTHHFK
jgi:hypothetical protein